MGLDRSQGNIWKSQGERRKWGEGKAETVRKWEGVKQKNSLDASRTKQGWALSAVSEGTGQHDPAGLPGVRELNAFLCTPSAKPGPTLLLHHKAHQMPSPQSFHLMLQCPRQGVLLRRDGECPVSIGEHPTLTGRCDSPPTCGGLQSASQAFHVHRLAIPSQQSQTSAFRCQQRSFILLELAIFSSDVNILS